MILRHNARHPEDPIPLPQWITESPDNYATLKRPLPESKTERTYIYDVDYRCDPWDNPHIYDHNKLAFKIQIPNPQPQPRETHHFPPPPSPILKNPGPSPTVPVTVTSTPINAEDIICIEDKTLWQQKTEDPTIDSSSPPPTQTAPATAMTRSNDAEIEYPTSLPDDLDVIKEFIQHDKDDDYIPLMSAITLKKKKRMLFLPVDFNSVKIDALVDSGAYINAISERDAEKLRQDANQCIIHKAPPPPFKVQYANAELEQPLATYTLRFKIGNYTFEETFIVMNQMSFPIIGLAFLRKHAAILDTAQGTIDFPKIQITMALTDEMQKCNLKPITIKTEAKHTIPAQATRIIYAVIPVTTEHTITGTIQPLPQFDENSKLIVAPAITTARNKKVAIKVANTTDFPYTIAPDTKIAELQILKPEETKLIRPVDIDALNLLTEHDDVVTYINALMQVDKPEDIEEKFWFPTPDNPGNEQEHTTIQKRILKELRELAELEKLDPTENAESRQKFLSLFKWTDSLITGKDRENLETTLVEFNDIFARHRLDIGMNTQFKVSLTPRDDKPVYTQSLPVPINLKEDLTVELALMHKYGIITTLPFSKYASPIFAQRKPNGKLRLLVDLRKINALIADDYINNNHPVSTLSDAAQHLAGKKLFCKLDCSQAYHCLQMADQRSVELLAFNFASRTFAYRRLAQGLSRALSAFSSFMREYLDAVIKADQCAQYVDDIGIAANTTEQLIKNIRAVFKCIRQAGLKLTIEKCHFGVTQVEFLGRTITPDGIAPQDQKVKNFLSKVRFPKSKKQVQKYIGFVNYYRNYIPRLSEKLIGMYELLKADAKIKISEELVDNFKEINDSLAEACGLALRQPLAGKQYVLMTDASFRASGYALMIEENDEKKILSKKKTFAPVAFGSRVFSPAQLKMSIYCKEFLAIYHAFLEYSHILWETTIPTLVLTDNRSVTRFFQTKTTPPALWNACDYVLQFNFRIMHVAGSQNTAADFLSRLELTPKEKVQLKLRDDILTAPIEVNLQSSDVADEEQLFFLPDEEEESEQEIFARKALSKQRANDEHKKIFLPVTEVIKIPLNSAVYAFGAIKENARIRNEQDADPLLKALKQRVSHEEYDKHLLKTEPRGRHLLRHEERIIMKDGVLMRKYYGEDGSVTHNQVIIPKHLVPELLSTLHGKTNKHPGITKMIQECRAKYYFPGLARKIRAWVTSCPDCIANKRIDTRQIRPKMLSNTEFTLGPEDCLEVDILPNLPSSNGYQHIVTMMDVFSRYLFAYPTQDMTAKTVARCIIDVMTRHCYLPTVILTDKGSQFRSEIVDQIARTLDMRISHATTKHAQTIGILERTHASLKTSLKISTGERRSMWHKYVQIAVMNYNTSYHESLGCEPTTVFHGRIPYNILDIKLGLKPEWKKDNNDELTDQLQKQIAEIQQAAKDNLMQSYLKYKQYYDKKATATPLKVNDYCYVLNPKADNQSMKLAFKDCIWTGPYIIVKVLSNNNYVVRRTGTRYTQTLHRIRLRLYAPNQRVPDVTVRREDYLPDPEVKTTHNDWYAQAWETEFGEVLFGDTTENAKEETTITEITDTIESDEHTTQNDVVQTTTSEITTENDVAQTATNTTAEGDKTPPDNVTSFNLDVSDNPYILTPPPLESPPKTPELPPIVVGYNPRKVGRYNLRPNPKPNVDPDFRMLDSATTEELRQTHA